LLFWLGFYGIAALEQDASPCAPGIIAPGIILS
jgi:hypothetical protein